MSCVLTGGACVFTGVWYKRLLTSRRSYCYRGSKRSINQIRANIGYGIAHALLSIGIYIYMNGSRCTAKLELSHRPSLVKNESMKTHICETMSKKKNMYMNKEMSILHAVLAPPAPRLLIRISILHTISNIHTDPHSTLNPLLTTHLGKSR